MMQLLRHAPVAALLLACLTPLPAMAAAQCHVAPESQQALPALVGRTTYPHAVQQAHDVSLRVVADAQGNPVEASVDGSTSADATRRSAMRWKYRCDGDKGGIAEWVLHQPAQHCKMNLTVKGFNPPRYPPKAFKAGTEGEVLLGLYPQGDGLVARHIIIAQSSGSTVLDEAAVTAAGRWSFDCDAGMEDAEPGQEVPVNFRLN